MTPNKDGFSGRMNPEAHYEKEIARQLGKLGPFRSVERFASKYGKLTTKRAYLSHLARYLAWLKDEAGVGLDPDARSKRNIVLLPLVRRAQSRNAISNKCLYVRNGV